MRFDPRSHHVANRPTPAWLRPRGIRSIQRGTISITNTNATNTATITAVDTANAFVRFLGNEATDAGSEADRDCVYLSLTNSTTVTATRVGTINSLIVSYEVVEYFPGVIKSIQFGTVTIASLAASGTATITSVDTTRATCTYDGASSADTVQTSQAGGMFYRVTLTNATTVTANRSGSPAAAGTVAFTVVEWY